MDLGSIFKSLLWDSLVRAGLQRLFTAVPLLGWGPLGTVITWAVFHFSDQLYETWDTAVDLKAIALKKEEHRKAFDRASIELWMIAKTEGVDSPDYKRVREQHKIDLSRLVHYGTE